MERELELDEILETISGVDLVLVEGYKRAGMPAIEIVRAELGVDLIGGEEQLVAVAANVKLNVPVPVFDLDDVEGIAAFIEQKFILGAV